MKFMILFSNLFFLTFFSLASSASVADLDRNFDKATFKIGSKETQLYIADTDSKRAQGLMFVKSLPEDTGMIFVFESERPLGFWMKNTLIPLNIGFFDKKGILVDVQEMKVADSIMTLNPPLYQSQKESMFAVEMNKGWYHRNKVELGSRIKYVSGGSQSATRIKSVLSDSSPRR